MAVVLKQPPEQESHQSRKVSFEEFLQRENQDGVEEWVNGEIVTLTHVTDRHARTVILLITLFQMLTELRGIGSVYGEPFTMRATNKGNGRSPDILFVRTEHKDRIKSAYLDGPADLVIEIVSPGSVKTDYLIKRAEYEQAGIPEYWIIDPVSSETAFLILGENGVYQEAELAENGRYASAMLDGMTFDPTWFHQETLPMALDILKDWGLL